MSDTNNPLVSFCVMSCNQRDYIETTFQAALDQDYSPLEIVVSDDASKDGSWEIIQKMAAAYKGPHKIVLSRNEKNLGIIGNWQKLCQLSSGEILIKADGDDVSTTNRASVIVKDWVESGRSAMVLASSCDVIDNDGRVIGEKLLPAGWDKRSYADIAGGSSGMFYQGCVIACHRSIFDDFPLIEYMGACDDSVYEARGLLSKAVVKGDQIVPPFRMIAEKLVRYRKGSGHTTGGAYRKFMTKGANLVLQSRLQTLRDLETAKNYLPRDYFDSLRKLYKSHSEHQRKVLALYTGTFAQRLTAYFSLAGESGYLSKTGIIYIIWTLPKWLGDILFSLAHKA